MDSLLYALLFAAQSIGMNAVSQEHPASYGSVPHFQPVAQQDSTYFEPPGDLPYNPESSGGDIKMTEERLPKGALTPGNPRGHYVIVPSDWENRSLSMKEGCWAKVYDEDGLSGDALTIMGPIDMQDVGGDGVFGIEWKDRISSIETGKRAEMVIYDNANLNDPLVRIGPGQKANINNAIRSLGEIRSLRINCTR